MEMGEDDENSSVASMGSDIECEGVGEVVFSDSKNRQFYQSCQLSNLIVTVGDCARVTIEKKHSYDEEAFGFAQILAIYENADHEMFVEVRWLEVPSELRKQERALLSSLGEDELIETDTVDDIPAGAIVEIISIAGTDMVYRSTQSNQYTCRYWKKEGTIHEVSPRTIYLRGYNASEYKEAYPMTAGQNYGIDENDPYMLAIQKLHLSVVPESLPCRGKETDEVARFLRNRMARRSDAGTGPMLLCGMPGTGKTACVLSTIKALRKEVEIGTLPDFNFTEINCLHLKHPMDAYAQLWRGISGHHISSRAAFHKLKHYFDSNIAVTSSADCEKIVLVCLVDELDFLLTKDMRLLFSFLDWARSNGQRSFILIGVANTLNLMEQVTTRRIASRATVEYNRISFSPYNHDQIHEIIMHRLSSLTIPGLPPSFIMLLSRKAATAAGDMRSALKICRSTLLAWKPHGLLVSETVKASAQVFANIINEAIESYRRSPFISGLASLSQLEIAILICFCEERRNVCGDEKGSSAASLTAAMLWEHIASLLHKIQQQKLVFHENAMKIHLILPPSYLVTKAIDRLMEKGILRSKTTHLKCGKPIVLYFLNLIVHNVDVVAGLRGTPWESFFS